MNRDNAVIKNKLLDAFIPALHFASSTSPFQPKSQVKVEIVPHNRLISRQSYISLEEDISDDSLIV